MITLFRIHTYFLLIMIPLIITHRGCTVGQTRLSGQNLAYMYKSRSAGMHPDFYVYHFSSDSSCVYFRIKTNELTPASDSGKVQVKLKITCMLTKNYEGRGLLDSCTYFLCDSFLNSTLQSTKGKIAFRMKDSLNAFVDLRLEDLNKKSFAHFYLHADKTSDASSQNYLITELDEEPVYNHVLNPEASYHLEFRGKAVHDATIRKYSKEFPLPPPPFSENKIADLNFAPDSSYDIKIDTVISGTNFSDFGLYQICSGKNKSDGITVYQYGIGFPNINSPERMIEPIRYLNSKKEYDEILADKNKKEAVDTYWLKRGSDPDRSRELIRRFYNRAVESNKYFTSFTPGWKTDRGIIYIIFGSPNAVYRNATEESWVYNDAAYNALTFNFRKTENKFSDNDYTLIRQPAYESVWFRGVEMWRQGRVISE